MKKTLHFPHGNLSIVSLVLLGLSVLVGLTFILAGAWLIGILPIIICVGLFSVREGIYVDLEHKKYKSYLKIFGIEKATWKNLPEGTKVCIRILKLSGNWYAGRSANTVAQSTTTYELYFYLPGPARAVIKRSDDLQSLHDEAQFISQHTGFECVIDQRISL